jgi:hypothetical protein
MLARTVTGLLFILAIGTSVVGLAGVVRDRRGNEVRSRNGNGVRSREFREESGRSHDGDRERLSSRGNINRGHTILAAADGGAVTAAMAAAVAQSVTSHVNEQHRPRSLTETAVRDVLSVMHPGLGVVRAVSEFAEYNGHKHKEQLEARTALNLEASSGPQTAAKIVEAVDKAYAQVHDQP